MFWVICGILPFHPNNYWLATPVTSELNWTNCNIRLFHLSKCLLLCSTEKKSREFAMTGGWVNYDRCFIFGWTNIPLRHSLSVHHANKLQHSHSVIAHSNMSSSHTLNRSYFSHQFWNHFNRVLPPEHWDSECVHYIVLTLACVNCVIFYSWKHGAFRNSLWL